MKKILLYLALFLFLAGFVFSCFGYFGKNNKSNLKFKTAVVEKRDMKKTILATGTVKPMVGAEVKVGARVSGKVERLFVKVGDNVKKNDIIAIVEHDDIKARVDQAKANLNAERARREAIEKETPKEIKKLKAKVDAVFHKLKLAEANYKRDKSLLKKGVVSAEKFDSSLKELEVLNAELRSEEANLVFTETKFDNDLKLARTQVAQAIANINELETDVDYNKTKFKNDLVLAKSKVSQAAANLQEIKIDLSYATIKSPISGVIASISTQEGETVASGLNSPTFVNIIDLKRLQITAFVDETDIGNVENGQESEFTVDTYPGAIFKGVVKEIYPKAVIQENVVNYEVIIDIPDSAMMKLRPEMTTNVKIVIGQRKDALVVPKNAINRNGNNSFVLVKKSKSGNSTKKSHPIKKNIKIGWRDEGFVEIREGLKLGDEVLISDKNSSGFGHSKIFAGGGK